MHLLKACIRLNDVETGSKLHAAIASRGLDRDAVIGCTLVDLYTKGGKLQKAQEVFDKLQARDVIAWTVLIAGYTKHRRAEEALFHYEQMLLAGILPAPETLSCCLRACSSIQETRKGQEIHAEVARRGLLVQDHTIGNALVDMYANSGLLAKAREVFYEHQNRDVVSWTSIIQAYVRNGQSEEALQHFEEMQHAGVSPDVVAFVCVIKACRNLRAAREGLGLHIEIARHNSSEKNLILGNALVDMYANCSLLSKAREVFDKLPVKDRISYTSLIGGYADHGNGNEALDLLEQMQLCGIKPNAVTYVCGLKACRSIGALYKGEAIHEAIVNQGLLEKDLTLANTLIDMYANCGSFAKAHEVFNELPIQNAVSWTALIAGYANHGQVEEALSFFDQMQQKNAVPDAVAYACALKACGSIGAVEKGRTIHEDIRKRGLLGRNLVLGNTLVDMYAKCGLLVKAKEVFNELPVRDVVSWNALLAGYVNNDHCEKALKHLKQMQSNNVLFDQVTIICGLKACGSLGAAHMGGDLQAEVFQRGFLKQDMLVINAVVDMYVGCGLIAKAKEVFNELPAPDVVSWTSLVAGYGQLGESEKAFRVLDRMREVGETPNLVTFQSVLNACSHVGLVDEAGLFLRAMTYHDLPPSLGHYTCIIDLLGRAGQLEMVIAIIEHMPFLPNLVIWHVLMGVCRRWGHVELGRHAFEHAVVLDEMEPSTYISVNHIFVHAIMMERAEEI